MNATTFTGFLSLSSLTIYDGKLFFAKWLFDNKINSDPKCIWKWNENREKVSCRVTKCVKCYAIHDGNNKQKNRVINSIKLSLIIEALKAMHRSKCGPMHTQRWGSQIGLRKQLIARKTDSHTALIGPIRRAEAMLVSKLKIATTRKLIYFELISIFNV